MYTEAGILGDSQVHGPRQRRGGVEAACRCPHLTLRDASRINCHPKELSSLRREKKRRSAGHFCNEIVFELNTDGRGALPELPRWLLRLLQTIDKVLGL